MILGGGFGGANAMDADRLSALEKDQREGKRGHMTF